MLDICALNLSICPLILLVLVMYNVFDCTCLCIIHLMYLSCLPAFDLAALILLVPVLNVFDCPCIFNIQHACDFRISTFTRQTIASKEMGQNNSRSQANKVHFSLLVHTFVC